MFLSILCLVWYGKSLLKTYLVIRQSSLCSETCYVVLEVLLLWKKRKKLFGYLYGLGH